MASIHPLNNEIIINKRNKTYLNYFSFNFFKEQINERYKLFLINEIILKTTFLTCLLFFIFYFIRFIHIIIIYSYYNSHNNSHNSHNSQNNNQNNYYKLALFGESFRFFSTILGLFYCYILKNSIKFHYFINKYLFYINDLILIFITIGGNFALIYRTISPECDGGFHSWDSFCNPYSTLKIIPLDAFFFNLSNIVLFTIIFKTHHLWISLLSILLVIVSVIISYFLIGVTKLSWPIFVIIFSIITYTIVIIEIHMYSYRLFQSFQRLENSIEEKYVKTNQEILFQLQYNELHHMIGNVAHDMNTPLQAFIMELDILDYHLNDYQLHQREIIKSHTSSSDNAVNYYKGLTSPMSPIDNYLDLKIDAFAQSLVSLRYISSFMSMMINRATDYHKIRNNMPLLPHFTLTNILEILKHVEACVISSTIDIPILIEDLPPNVMPNIMTDKSWLLENLLLLLSNAQKFTSDGSIVVRCQLERNLSKYQEIVQESNLLLGHDTSISPIKKKPENFIKHHSLNGHKRPPNPTLSPTSTREGYTFHNYDMLSRSKTNEEYILFEIEDSGSGISPKRFNGVKKEESFNFVEKTEKLSYFQTNQSYRASETGGGTGISLYVISKRVEALGGLFGVKPRGDLKSGSCFWILIPYEPEINLISNEFQSIDSFVPTQLKTFRQPAFDSIADAISSNDTQSRPNSFCLKSRSDSENELGHSKVHQNQLAIKQHFNTSSNYIQNSSQNPAPPLESLSTSGSASILPVSQLSGEQTRLSNRLSISTTTHTNAALQSGLNNNNSNSNSNSNNLNNNLSYHHHNNHNHYMNHNHHNNNQRVLKVLVVDDSILIQKTVSRALEQCGYQVDIASHGYQCLAMIEKNKNEQLPQYDIILMDIQMPQLDGIETTKLIRKLENQIIQEVPSSSSKEDSAKLSTDMKNESIIKLNYKKHFIIGFSANSDRTTYTNALDAGMNTFTSKPLSMEKFHSICDSNGIFS